MRTLAIGDIHGCFWQLKLLESAAQLSAEDRIVTLGDLVDRGPDTRQVIQWHIDRSDWNLIPICGNHEIMMLSSASCDETHEEWLNCGGDAVLESYGVNHVSEIPVEHLQFIERQLVPYHVAEKAFFVHANAWPELDLDEQPDEILYWDTAVERAAHVSGRTMICGHTPQRDGIPLDMGHAICIDTAACKGGWLTCLDVNSRYCWQANQQGETRSFWLDEGPSQ